MENEPTRPILLTWDSFNNGFQVAVRAIDKLWEDHQVRIAEVLYLQTGDLNEGNLAELKVFRQPAVWTEQEAYIQGLKSLKGDRKQEIIERLQYVAEQASAWEDAGCKPEITQKRISPSKLRLRTIRRSTTRYSPTSRNGITSKAKIFSCISTSPLVRHRCMWSG
ncbi:MAG: hypothetical protein OHK0039_20860 [Bacteroidia bacterium]